MSALNTAALIMGYVAMGAGLIGVCWLAIDAATGFAQACSITRFYLAVGRKNKIDMPITNFPRFFLRYWWCCMEGKMTIQGQGGYWRGIGNWKAYEKGEQA